MKRASKIEQMEKSVLGGGANLVDRAKQQEEEIHAQATMLRRQQEEQKRLANRKRNRSMGRSRSS